MAEAGFLEARRMSPTGLALAIGLDAAVIGAAVTWQIATPARIVPDPPPVVYPVPLPKPAEEVTEKPKPRTPAESRQQQVIETPPIQIELPPITENWIEPADSRSEGAVEVGSGPITGPIIPQKPVIRPARAKGNIQNLITSEDYPEDARRREQAGTVRARLEIGTDGKVKGCAVLASSGSTALDAATCRLLRARARFTPATDQHGQTVAGSYETPKIIWRLEG